MKVAAKLSSRTCSGTCPTPRSSCPTRGFHCEHVREKDLGSILEGVLLSLHLPGFQQALGHPPPLLLGADIKPCAPIVHSLNMGAERKLPGNQLRPWVGTHPPSLGTGHQGRHKALEDREPPPVRELHIRQQVGPQRRPTAWP